MYGLPATFPFMAHARAVRRMLQGLLPAMYVRPYERQHSASWQPANSAVTQTACAIIPAIILSTAKEIGQNENPYYVAGTVHFGPWEPLGFKIPESGTDLVHQCQSYDRNVTPKGAGDIAIEIKPWLWHGVLFRRY